MMSSSSKERWLDRLLLILVHVMSLILYAIPVLYAVQHHDGLPVLDEAHIVTDNNADVNGRSSWEEVWKNDYWGRSMNADSSHKSWRPFSVASFRIFATLVEQQHHQLWLHRVINIVIHAAVAEMVGNASLLFFSNEHEHPFILKCMSKIFFAIHPSHVECVVNAANRPHILALIFSLLCIDSDTPYLFTVVSWICGLLSSETFLFQLPAVLLSLTLVQYNKLKTNSNTHSHGEPSWKKIILTLFPRYIILTIASFAYLIYRHLNDWISIPEGLIRPAENPFYNMTGMRRILNFAYILSLHIFKSLGLDLIGYSHEYGFDCISELGTRGGIPTTGGMYQDTRLCLPILLLIALICITIKSWNQRRSEGLLKVLVATSWFATLFPVSGFVKVGTFVSDRIVIASTVSTCIFGSHILLKWIVSSSNDNDKVINTNQRSNVQKIVTIVTVCSFFASKAYFRSVEWMNSKDLMLSSLRTCPRSIKSHLEMSKIHQGLYPEMLDLTKGLYHLEVAEKIDPDFCDLHQQFAFIHLRQNKIIQFEERLTKCLLCPFTMSGCMGMWNQYWQTTLRQSQLLPEDQRNEIQHRYNKYMVIVNEAVEKEQQKQKLNAKEKDASFSDEL